MRSDSAFVVGISGPDGSGKSSLVEELLRRFSATDVPVVRTYVFGCVICRNVPPGLVRGAMSGGRIDAGRPSTHGERTSFVRRSLVNAIRALHGVVDAGELALRLWAARRTAESHRSRQPDQERFGAREAAPIVLTDRSPLDGLVKFAPSPGTLVDRVYRQLGNNYGLVLVLQAPAVVLAQRDRDHDPEVLADLATRFEWFASRLGQVVRLETGDRTPVEVANDAESAVREAALARTRASGGTN